MPDILRQKSPFRVDLMPHLTDSCVLYRWARSPVDATTTGGTGIHLGSCSVRFVARSSGRCTTSVSAVVCEHFAVCWCRDRAFPPSSDHVFCCRRAENQQESSPRRGTGPF